MKKYLAILLAIVMACTILAACGGNASSTTQPASSEGAVSSSAGEPATAPDVTLSFSWWGNQTRTERTEGACNLYTELHPNVTFELMPTEQVPNFCFERESPEDM